VRKNQWLSLLLVALAFGWLGLANLVAAGQPPAPPRQATATPAAMATPDRLAAPPTVGNPSQADEGAQLYWLHCQPCHGDQGQGLTDEWRAQYPPEDQNCWESGCHGARPYENGFVLPTAVPAVIGEGSLSRFATAAELYAFVSATMPYQWPGTLTESEYLAITAHLVRGRGLWQGTALSASNLVDIHFAPVEAAPAATPSPVATASAAPPVGAGIVTPVLAAAVALALVMIGVWLWRRHRQKNHPAS
jgi:hypothetical protein